jgi:hypothetical protein
VKPIKKKIYIFFENKILKSIDLKKMKDIANINIDAKKILPPARTK